jgi:hypothetical protein
MTLAMDIPQKATGDPDEILALSVNPADRFWRYPICNFVVKWLAKTPLTPNHITIVHTALSVGAGFIIAIGTTRAFIVAGIMFETRSVLDCLDGVLARATGKSSPFGRALDQLGDTIGFLSLMGGALVCIARLYGWWAGLATIFVGEPNGRQLGLAHAEPADRAETPRAHREEGLARGGRDATHDRGRSANSGGRGEERPRASRDASPSRHRRG